MMMACWGVYWKNFAADSGRRGWPTFVWHTNSQRMARLEPGDCLWLFTNGRACDMPGEQQAWLVQLLVVAEVQQNTGQSEHYAVADFRYTIVADRQRSLPLKPPLLVDAALRPDGARPDAPIGTLRQGPWRLSERALSRLAVLLDDRRRPPQKLGAAD